VIPLPFMEKLKITILGSGTSQGIPVIACDCDVCQSADPKDNRLRSSILISKGDKNIIVDTGPDFRQQMLEARVQSLEAILFTHSHKDHVAGMDDIRAFNYRSQKPVEVWADDEVQKSLHREFYYVFEENKYPGVPSVNLNDITKEPFEVIGEQIIPITVMHYKLPVLAFRLRDFVYITDAKTIEPEEYEKLRGVKVLILNALRKEPHISHLTLEEALEIIEDLKPEQAYLTHISHLMGRQEEVSKELPENVQIAYDGLEIEID